MAEVARVGTGRRPEGEIVRALALGDVGGSGPLVREPVGRPVGICGAGSLLVWGKEEGGAVAAAGVTGGRWVGRGVDGGRGDGG